MKKLTSEKVRWKLNIQKTNHGIQSHHFMGDRWGNNGYSERLYFLGLQITADVDCSHEIKRHLLLGRKAMIGLVQFSCSVVSNSLQPHESQHARPPCPLPTPGVYPNSCHWVGDAIQPCHPLLSPSPPASNLSQHQGLFKWVSSSHHVDKVLEFQLQHQSFQWIFRFPLGWTGWISL